MAVAAVIALMVGGLVLYGLKEFNSIERVSVDVAAARTEQPRNILVVGSDTRDLDASEEDSAAIFGGGSERAPGGQRADSILIARIDPRGSSVELLSIPRDLWVRSPGGKSGRINAAYNQGAQTLIDTIKANLGVSINHYVEVNFNGFKGLVDAIGGVPLYFDRPVRDRHSGLRVDETGCQVLQGSQALAFARSRHLEVFNGKSWREDGTADLGRITRQQIFLRHSLAKISTLGIGDVNTLRQLIGVATGSVRLDDSLGTSELIDLAQRFSSFDSDAMVVHRLPTTPFRTAGGSEVLKVDAAAGTDVLDIFRGDKPATVVSVPPTTALSPSAIRVTVLNAAGVAGMARTAADGLATHGFAIGEVGNTTRAKDTVLSHATGGEAQAALVAETISPKPVLKADPGLALGTVTVAIGSGFGRVSTGSVTPTAPTSTAAPTTTVPAPGSLDNGVPAGESTAGVAMGDPPPGVACG